MPGAARRTVVLPGSRRVDAGCESQANRDRWPHALQQPGHGPPWARHPSQIPGEERQGAGFQGGRQDVGAAQGLQLTGVGSEERIPRVRLTT